MMSSMTSEYDFVKILGQVIYASRVWMKSPPVTAKGVSGTTMVREKNWVWQGLDNSHMDHTCTRGNANTGGRFNICVSDVRGTEAPLTGNIRRYTGTMGSRRPTSRRKWQFVSNTNIFTILFLTPTITIEWIIYQLQLLMRQPGSL